MEAIQACCNWCSLSKSNNLHLKEKIGRPASLSTIRATCFTNFQKKQLSQLHSTHVRPFLQRAHISGLQTRSSRRGSSIQLTSPQCAVIVKESWGAAAVQGTGRTTMEDTFTIEVDETGKSPSFFGVFDGHGGFDVAAFLQTSLWAVYKAKLTGGNLAAATVAAFQEVDEQTLAAPKGLFGMMRERGMGGSRCGSTAATAVLLPGKDGWQLVAANVGDSRVVLARGGAAVQLSVDHKPDIEEERKRIEAKNPTPKKPLVFVAGGVWRVGGLLALSRAFGDVYLKDWSDGLKEGARGGFGLTAEPSVAVQTLTPEDSLLVLGTDGLFDTLGNQQVVDFCLAAREEDLGEVAKKLAKLAQDSGATDDVTAVIVRLPSN